jgi:hypothetical protein
MYPDEVKDACNKQLHSQVRREARRAWQLQNINQHSASLHVD